MKFFAALLALLLLAACAPAYLTPAPGGAVLPVEAQRVIDQATATAAAMATSGAQAAASEQAFEKAATAARAATLDALGSLQTESAVQMTQEAALEAATVTTAVRTQSAGQTQAWATPSAAAVRTQAALDAQSQAQAQRDAAALAEFWQTLRTVFVALFVVGGLTAVAVVAIDRVSRTRQAEWAARAVIARENFRLLAPGHWAEYRPDDGYQVYPLPELTGGRPPPPIIVDNWPTSPSREHEWRQAVRLFAWWGDRYGFGIDALGASGARVVTDPAWRELSRLLKGAGVLANRQLPGQKGRVTAWADQWNYTRFSHEMSHGPLQLTFPIGDDPPKVLFTVPTQQQN